MAERYTRLFTLPTSFYAENAPVLIRAGALLRDAYSQDLLVQLKFYNLDPEEVTGLKVRIQMLDALERPLGKEIRRSYRDLHAAEDAEFGQNTALILPGREARAFAVRVTEVSFSDGAVWEDEESVWEPVEKQKTLLEAYGDEEMAEQFRIRYGTDCAYAPMESGSLWFCTCGLVNHSDEGSCRRCHRVRRALLNVNPDSLRQESQDRVRQEAAEAAEESKPARRKSKAPAVVPDPEPETEGETEPAPPRRRLSFKLPPRLLIPLCAAFLAALLLIFIGPRFLNRVVPLPSPAALATEEPSPEPTVEPTPLPTPEPTPEPTPSPEELQKAAYDEACKLLDENQYSKAVAALEALDGYEDSADRIREANYRKALALYTFMETYDSEGIYARLSMDPAKKNRFSFSEEKAAALGNSALDELRAACGQDEVKIDLADTPAKGLKPIGDCLTTVFRNLGDYKDSSARLEGLKELTNYMSAFFALCESGELAAAAQWLHDYTGEFEQKEEWLTYLGLYLPFCDNWGLFSGDPTVIPLTAGKGGSCMSLNTSVSLKDGLATLHFYWIDESGEHSVELVAEPGDPNFYLQIDPFQYMAVISATDHLAYMKYDGQATLWSSCEYERIR